MSYFPALLDFEQANRIRRGQALWRVYMAIQPMLDFATAKPVKTIALARQLKMGRHHVRAAIAQLIADGYLLDHGRGRWGVRLLRLAHVRATTQTGEAKAS